jgi:putative CocE/NonD family hydrolase
MSSPRLLATLLTALALVGTSLPALAGTQSPTPAWEPYRPGILKAHDLEIPVSDGSIVRADVYRRAGAGDRALPVAMLMFPYKKDDASRLERDTVYALARAGFASMVVDVRGTGASPGEFCFFCRREVRDGYDAVEWAARQPWSNGRVGMWGYSYSGITAAHVAAQRPPHLRAIVAGSAFSDAYRDLMYPGGIRASADFAVIEQLFQGTAPYGRASSESNPATSAEMFVDALGNPSTIGKEFLERDTYDRWWQERALENKAHRVDVPVLHVSGWHDLYPRAATLNYRQMDQRRRALLVGPWGHIGPFTPTTEIGSSERLWMRATTDWLRMFVGTPPGAARRAMWRDYPKLLMWDQDPAARSTYHDTAAWRGQWREHESWPPARRTQTLSLCPEPADDTSGTWPVRGALRRSGCQADGRVPVLSTPADATSGTSVYHDIGVTGDAHDPADQRAALSGTAFVGPATARTKTITGGLRLSFSAASAGTDVDWVAKVVDIAPDGSAELVTRGWLKASHRRKDPSRPYLFHTHQDPRRLTPGKVHRLDVEIWPTSYRLRSGHRLGVLLQTADTQKVLPSNEAVTSEIVIDASHPATLSVPLRLVRGTRAADPLRTYSGH